MQAQETIPILSVTITDTGYFRTVADIASGWESMSVQTFVYRISLLQCWLLYLLLSRVAVLRDLKGIRTFC